MPAPTRDGGGCVVREGEGDKEEQEVVEVRGRQIRKRSRLRRDAAGVEKGETHANEAEGSGLRSQRSLEGRSGN